MAFRCSLVYTGRQKVLLMNRFLLLFPFVAFIHTATAQCAFTLSGKVIDAHDKKPLEFAQLYIPELRMSAVADSTGYYHFKNLCTGTYTVLCQHVGCDSVVAIIQLTENRKKNFYPEHHAHELALISVTTKKTKETATQSVSELKGRSLEETKGKTLGDALKIIPGLSSMQTGSGISKPVIHGMHSNRILLLNNGIRQEGQQWGSEHAPEIDPFIAGKLTVIKGANSVRYGSDAIAGVILVEPSDLRDSAGLDAVLHMVAKNNGQAGIVSGMVEQNLKALPALSWRIQGTLKKSGNVRTPHYYLKNTGVNEYNFSGTSTFTKKKYGIELFYSQFNTTIGIFSGAHIGNVSDLYDAIQRPAPLEQAGFSYAIARPYQHIEHELGKAKFYVLTGTAGKLSITYARQYNLRYEYDKHKPLNDSIAALNKPELQFEITSHSTDIAWEHHSFQRFTGTIGIGGLTQGNTYSGRFFIPNYRNYSGGIYWIERYTKNKWQLEAGVRYDYKWLRIFKYESRVLVSPVYTFRNPSATLGLIYKKSESLSFNFNAGSAWRAPGVNELYSDGIHHGTATFEIGDKSLTSEKAYNFIAGVKYRNEKFNVEAEVYHNRIHGFIYLKPQLPATVTIHGAFPTFVYTQVNANFSGIDAQLNYRLLASLLLTVKASILRAFDKTHDEWLIQMPADHFSGEATYHFKICKRLSENYFSWITEYTNKQWRVPANADYLEPPRAYTLVNIEAGTTCSIKQQRIVIGLGCGNVFNITYRNYMDRFRYYADEPGRSITLRLKVPFNYSKKSIHNNSKNQSS